MKSLMDINFLLRVIYPTTCRDGVSGNQAETAPVQVMAAEAHNMMRSVLRILELRPSAVTIKDMITAEVEIGVRKEALVGDLAPQRRRLLLCSWSPVGSRFKLLMYSTAKTLEDR